MAMGIATGLGIGAAVRFAINTRGRSDGWPNYWEQNPFGDNPVSHLTYRAMRDRYLPGSLDATRMLDLTCDPRLPAQKVDA